MINAMEFAGTSRNVTLVAEQSADGGLEIRVVDHGPGMTPQELAHTLYPFVSGSSRRTRRQSDTGPGLPLARAFTELPAGSLTPDSAVDRGTTVRVRHGDLATPPRHSPDDRSA